MPIPVDLAALVDPAAIDADLRVLSGVDPDATGAPILSRNIEHADIRRASTYIQDELAAAGWTVTEEPFTASRVPCWNIVAERPGLDDEVILLGAHYDSIAAGTAGWDAATDPAPGAEDDASGVAAVLGVARVLGAWDAGFQHTIRLVLFSAEEQGLYGSEAYVAEHGADVITYMAQLDPVGHDDGQRDVFVVYDPRWPALADDLVATGDSVDAELALVPVDASLIGGDLRSDHAPFWTAGVPALHVSAPENLTVNHTVEDTYELVSPALVAEVAELVTADIATRAGPVEVGDTGGEADEETGGCGCGGGARAEGWLVIAGVLASRRRWGTIRG